MKKKEPLIVIGGPTASGKSSIAIQLARDIGGEIISADSMQVYRGMDIGTAKVTKEEMQGVPHHLIDIAGPKEAFNVVSYKQAADEAIGKILGAGHIPILAGGTGFYIQAVLRDIQFTENDTDMSFREQLMEIAAQEDGPGRLYARLQEVDPEAARQIHPNNVKRIVRALEFYLQTGQKISEHNEQERHRKSPYNYAYFVLTMPRQQLYAMIEKRVDQMLDAGLVDEVRRLRAAGCTPDMVSMQGLGYKEIFPYLDGICTLNEAAYILKRDTRHFAKRQLTWFRREKDIIWLDRSIYDSQEKLLDRMEEELRKRGILENE